MEEKKMNEAQVEQTAPQVESELDIILNENKALKEANEQLQKKYEQLQKKYESEKKSCMRYYRQMTMLKQAITQLIGEQRITEEEAVKAVLTGQSVITLEDLLFTLSD
jgi:hypothetical protein